MTNTLWSTIVCLANSAQPKVEIISWNTLIFWLLVWFWWCTPIDQAKQKSFGKGAESRSFLQTITGWVLKISNRQFYRTLSSYVSIWNILSCCIYFIWTTPCSVPPAPSVTWAQAMMAKVSNQWTSALFYKVFRWLRWSDENLWEMFDCETFRQITTEEFVQIMEEFLSLLV